MSRYRDRNESVCSLADIMQVIMFETAESAWVEMDEYDYYFCVTQPVGFTTMLLAVFRAFKHWFFLLCIKKLAEFIGQLENFSNFILGEHSGNRFKVIIQHYKVNTFIAILLIIRKLFLFDLYRTHVNLYNFVKLMLKWRYTPENTNETGTCENSDSRSVYAVRMACLSICPSG